MHGDEEQTSAFALPERLRAKASPALIGADERTFARIGDALARTVFETAERLARVRLEPAGSGQQALDRDLEVQRLSARLRVLRRFGVDASIGSMARTGGEVVHIGRFGLSDATGSRLLVDPDGFGAGLTGAVDRYVAMTRATAQLVILTTEDTADTAE